MKMTFIGSGAAFTHDNYHSNILIELGGKKLLIDCGSDARFALHELGYTHRDIDAIYISHIHADHVGGLEYIGYSTKFDPGCRKKPELLAHKNILSNLWEHSLSGGMNTIDTQQSTLKTYFQTTPLNYPGNFIWDGINFQLVKTLHVKNSHTILDSYGLCFTVNGKTVFITTDTRLLKDDFMPFYEKSHVIFHDCETQIPGSIVHAHYSELKELPASIKSKMWLYHYNSDTLPNAALDGFLGFVKKGQKFEL